ncbi:hypothetical protein IW140_000359 [Coemansia sp. RSA 1813]|nr:hypothetical protein LPJ74_000741 [Coemansia sp. RSA 1843]KAJ2092699.1 hypothetical protein IW138_000793 [Coemansia sp. RSA 986]KAJ2572961.1 hypothetical protein IW140_000359 [Coemansia sp. RSA 1813]
MATEVESPTGGSQQQPAHTETAAGSTPTYSVPDSDNRASIDSSVRSSSGGGGTKLTEDEIEITFLMQTSERATRVLKVADTALDAKEKLLKDWPSQFGPQPSSSLELKFLYSGRYFENSQVLSSVQRYNGHPTVVHLIVNYNRPSPKEVEASA